MFQETYILKKINLNKRFHIIHSFQTAHQPLYIRNFNPKVKIAQRSLECTKHPCTHVNIKDPTYIFDPHTKVYQAPAYFTIQRQMIATYY